VVETAQSLEDIVGTASPSTNQMPRPNLPPPPTSATPPPPPPPPPMARRAPTESVPPPPPSLIDINVTAISQSINLDTIKIIPDNTDLDPKAVRRVPRGEKNYVGILTVDDSIIVCWDHVPSESEVRQAMQVIGATIIVGVADGPSALQSIIERADPFYDLMSEYAEGVIQVAIDHNATDIHLAVGSIPKMRIGGHLRPMPDKKFVTSNNMEEVMQFLIRKELIEEFRTNHDIDTSTTYAGWRMRISLYQQKYSQALAIRIIPRVIPELEDLGVPAIVLKLLKDNAQGLFLVCGVTGSGKSTTLAAGINNINRDFDLHILTIEDPIEYVHEDRKSTIHQREVKQDTKTFQTALRHALRQDPDVILVGEMRDYETMQMALEAAETGHLVLATVHSRDTAAVIKRMVASFPPGQQEQVRMQLADALIGVVIQKLIPAANSTTGRYLATEVMVTSEAIRTNIRNNKLHELKRVIEGASGSDGSHLMDDSLARLTFEGKITREVAMREATNLTDFESNYAKYVEGKRMR